MTAGNYGRVDTLDQLKRLCDKLLEQNKPIGFDVETGYVGPDREKGALDWSWANQFVVGFSFTNDKRWARYVPIAHDLGDNLPEAETWEVMKPVLETLPVKAHHFKFEAHNLHMLDIKGRGPRIDPKFGGDTMLQGYVLQGCNRPDGQRAEFRTFGLKEMVLAIFDHQMEKIDSLFPENWTAKQKRCLRFNLLEVTPQVIAYGCEDSAWCLAADEIVEPQALAERRNMLLIENEISELMAEVEEFGMCVDWAAMEEERKKAIPFQARMEKAVKAGLGELAQRDLSTMNLGSVKQLKELIYRDLQFTTTRLTKGAESPNSAGKAKWELMSTDEKAMKLLATEHPALKKLLDWREVGNALARFDKWLDENHHSYDDRIHPSYGQVIVLTGRFAANEPPVQQMPKEWRWTTEFGLNVWANDGTWGEFIAREDTKPYVDYWTGNFRDYVVAPEGWYHLGFDYSQIELRILAGVSQEPMLIDAFEKGIDVHTLTSAMMLGKAVADVSPKDRDTGKTMNFALMYQQGYKALAEGLAVSMERGKELFDAYFAQFSSVTTWMQRARNVGEARGYAETPFGRKITVWDLLSDQSGIRAKGQRVLINAPIQGGAADLMKMAMIRIRRALVKRGWWGTHVKMVHNLHDALVFEAHNSIHPQELRDILEEAAVFSVKNFPVIVADWELGQKHGSCAKWKKGLYPVFNEETGYWEIVKPQEESQAAQKTVQVQVPAQVSETPTATMSYAQEHIEEINTEGVDLRVEVTSMPTGSQLQRLVDTLVSRPGSNTLVLCTPEGDVRCDVGTSVGVADQGMLSMILGGATVKHSADTLDLSSLDVAL